VITITFNVLQDSSVGQLVTIWLLHMQIDVKNMCTPHVSSVVEDPPNQVSNHTVGEDVRRDGELAHCTLPEQGRESACEFAVKSGEI
jgi:hypothetical protein